jgi:uncharacterized membrane protein YczE
MGTRMMIYILGLSITALGISLVILSQAGAGPWDVVAVGWNKHLGLTIGTWSMIAQAIVVLFTALIEKKRPQFESIIPIVVRSMILDVWIYLVFSNVTFSSPWEKQWFVFALGILVTGFGIGIYLLAKLPNSPIDGLMIALSNRFGWGLNSSRILIEVAAVIIGYLLGGPVGFGTLIIALTIGKIIQISNEKMERVLTTRNILVMNNTEKNNPMS